MTNNTFQLRGLAEELVQERAREARRASRQFSHRSSRSNKPNFR